ncbi:hypothetical protein, partial [Silvimonas sp.]|uniref:hypothetical protein n=1 Tax=Silvimonas sp. TaxID=2650811 RepID=UPI002840CBD8
MTQAHSSLEAGKLQNAAVIQMYWQRFAHKKNLACASKPQPRCTIFANPFWFTDLLTDRLRHHDWREKFIV